MAEGSGGSLRELVVSLFIKGDKESAKEAENSVDKLAEKFKELAEVAKVALEAFFVEKTFEFLEHTAEAAEHLSRTAARLGTSAEDFQKLDYAAKQTGATTEDLTGGLSFLARSMDAAHQGAGEQAQAFQRLGVHLKNADGSAKSVQDVFYDVADAMKATNDPGKRARISMELLGRGSRELIPTLMQGSEALKGFGEEAERFGVVQGESFFESAEKFIRGVKRIKAILGGLSNRFAQPIFESFTKVFDQLTDWYDKHSSEIIPIVERVGKIVGEIFEDLAQIVGAFFTLFGPLVDVFKVFFEDIRAGTPAFDILIASIAILAAIFAPWTALIVGIGLVLDDFFAYLRGGPSIIGHFVAMATDYWQQFQALFSNEILGDVIEAAFGPALKFIDTMIDGVKTLGSLLGAIPAGYKAIGELTGNSSWLIDDVKAAFGGGSSAQTAASNSTSNSNAVNSNFNAAVTINASPGSSSQDIAGAVTSAMDEWHDGKMREAYHGLVGAAQ